MAHRHLHCGCQYFHRTVCRHGWPGRRRRRSGREQLAALRQLRYCSDRFYPPAPLSQGRYLHHARISGIPLQFHRSRHHGLDDRGHLCRRPSDRCSLFRRHYPTNDFWPAPGERRLAHRSAGRRLYGLGRIKGRRLGRLVPGRQSAGRWNHHLLHRPAGLRRLGKFHRCQPG
ncbi:MAG: hypothetical protein BWY71_02297 [Planctomycetes bacterium ADurb.Bin412]|nr:MAG: hypothetical protein BWY71_02297 [Planctomycetes bacterium ADurb.Bin412]